MRQIHTRQENSGNDDANRQRVPQHNRRQRAEHGRALLILQPEGYGEQPAHGGGDFVEHAQPKNRPPPPEGAPRKKKKTPEGTPPSRRKLWNPESLLFRE